MRSVGTPAQLEIANSLREFIRLQPPGYRDGEVAETDKGFALATGETLRSYLAVWSSGWNIDLGSPALDLSRLLPVGSEAFRTCPVWVINDLKTVRRIRGRSRKWRKGRCGWAGSFQ